jgi:hypothetical protein
MRLLALLLGVVLTVGIGIAVVSGYFSSNEGPLRTPVSLPPGVGSTLPDGVRPVVPPAIGAGRAVACTTERSGLETAVAAFEATNGRVPANVDELVAARVLREPPVRHRVENGQVVSIDPECP